MIEQSIAKQYGVLPSMQGDLSYSDWAKMVGGLMDDTPLGRVVGIRSEKDKDIIKNFTPEQRKIRSDWASFKLTKIKAEETAESKQELTAIQTAFAKMFGGGNNGNQRR